MNFHSKIFMLLIVTLASDATEYCYKITGTISCRKPKDLHYTLILREYEIPPFPGKFGKQDS